MEFMARKLKEEFEKWELTMNLEKLNIDIIERKGLQWYGHVKRMQDETLPKLTMESIPGERRKIGRPRKTWMEGVRAAMKTRLLEADQWLNRKECCLGSGRRRQLSQDRKDR
jgi:hypothetical protein